MKAIEVVAAILLIIGGLNWGLYGSLHFDLVAGVLGPFSPLSRVVYVLVGLSALYLAVAWSLRTTRSHAEPASPIR